MYVPHALREGHALVRLVGRPHALVLCERLGGRRYDIPAARPAVRCYEARRRRRLGESHATIARALQITIGHVRCLTKDVVPEGGARVADAT